MSQFNYKSLNNSGVISLSAEPLGKGGEGSVYSVENFSNNPFKEDVVAKIYHKPEEGNRGNKIVAMLKNSPDSDSLAWPLAVITENNKFVGYLMKKLDFDNYRMWAELSHSQQRRDTTQEFDFLYALTAARNLVVAVKAVHDAGHCLGDINESNIFVKNDANVFIVDTDSAQIVLNDKIFPCTVGKPEYTAPELVGKNFKDVKRTFETDNFALVIAIYQMLTGGAHPTDGIFQGKGETPSVAERIKQNIYPNLGKGGKDFKRIERVPTDCLPKNIIKLFDDYLSSDPSKRSDLNNVLNLMDDSLDNLTQCSKVKQHWFDKNDYRKCPWCDHIKKGNVDIWGKVKTPSQKTLPNVKFGKNEVPKNVPNQRSQRVPHSQTQTTTASAGWNNNNNKTKPSSNSSLGNNQKLTNVSAQNMGFVRRFDPEDVSEKVKGKTVVQYGDGSLRVRPPLLEVYKTQPKFARKMFFDEFPDVLKFWWPTNRPLPVWWSLLVGLVVSCGIAFGWLFGIPLLQNSVPDFPYKELVFHYWALASFVSTLLFSSLLIIVSVKEILRMKKLYSFVSRVETEKWWRTVLRFVPISVFYGGIVVVLVVFGVIFAIIKGIASAVQNENREQVYYRY